MKREAHWKQIKGYNDKTWKQEAPKILHRALYAKFSQNAGLLQFLSSTTPNKLGEATDDPYWGIGSRLGDPKAFQVASWKTNTMGETLEMVRNELCTG
jgi:ribA/ribD-fused uncharacterized protein